MSDQHQELRPLSALSEAERAEAMKCYSVIQPCVEDNMSAAQAAQHHGLPLRTVQRWVALYRRSGLAGLARRARSDRGSQRALPAELKGDRKKAGELCGSRLTLGLRIESRIPFVEFLSEFFV
jgi:putative transposase